MLDKRTTDLVAYLTPIGWIIAFVAGNRRASRFHLNQALVCNLLSLVSGLVLGRIPLLGGLLVTVTGTYCIFASILGVVYALLGEEKAVPGLGGIRLLKADGADPLEKYYDQD